jgi:S1-C subfamily serine protease
MIPGEELPAWTQAHPTRDLAKIRKPEQSTLKAEGSIPNSLPFQLSQTPHVESVKTLSWILNMGFPLGFTDLYTDLGRVNSNSLATCGASSYPCLNGKFDFSTTNDTDHGSSGSPLLSMDGKVIGVVAAGTDEENVNFTWAIDASLYSGF